MATQELLNLAYDWQPTGVTADTNKRQPLIDPIRDLKINDIDFVDGTKRVKNLEQQITGFQCLQCKKINEHVSIMLLNVVFVVDGARKL